MPSFTITNRKKQEFVVLYDEEDTELLAQYTWHIAGGYVATHDRGLDGNDYRLYIHRRIMEAPEKMEVDHINGNKLDNRRENLRVCKGSQNKMNRSISINNKTGFNGVYWAKQNKKFRAMIGINGKRKHIGYFNTAHSAARAYNVAARGLFGKFAKINNSLVSF